MGYIGAFEQVVLWCVLRLGDGAYGVALRGEIEARTGRTVSSGAVYTALARLEERGLVASRLAEGSTSRGGRRRRYYRVEAAGARALQEAHELLSAASQGLLGRLAEALGE